MNTLRVLCIDDEVRALRRLELQLERIRHVKLVGLARNGRDAIELVAKLKPDVLLLDIRMGGMGGFEVVEALSGPYVPRVIFVTAFDAFAARAFAVRAVDYIVKPVELDRLQAALDKARHSFDAANAEERLAELREVVATLREEVRANEDKRFVKEIWAERRLAFVPVRVADIIWIEAERDYVRLHTGEASYLLRESIGRVEARLNPEEFVRIRRSALVRRERIVTIQRPRSDDIRVQLANGEELKAGSTYLKRLRQLIAARAD